VLVTVQEVEEKTASSSLRSTVMGAVQSKVFQPAYLLEAG